MDLAWTTPPLPAATIAATAVLALRAEALLTPKPGLVDRHGSGSHADMNLPMFLDSAEALQPTFEALAAAGAQFPVGTTLRDHVGILGRKGEAVMLDATGGVNTHRGALWTVGLLATAAGAATSEPDLFTRAGALAAIPDSAGRPPSTSHGQRAARTFRVTGAVGEAVAAFPHIRHVALPALRRAQQRGDHTDRAVLQTLLALISSVDDTCVLHRGGAAGLKWMQTTARRVQSSRNFDAALDRFVTAAEHRRLSPGGSADLLSGALFVDTVSALRHPQPTTTPAVPEEPTHAVT
jgi:triphosphoribosyl-dephospho-CoA synthase